MDFQVGNREQSIKICFGIAWFFSHAFLMDFGSILDCLGVGLKGQLRPNMGFLGANLSQLGPT